MLKSELRRLVESAPSVGILVAGDVMLDAYISGEVTRISPEAPVPVVAVSSRRYLPGGAANVAANLRAMGCTVTLTGVTGADDAGLRLTGELKRFGICPALVTDAARVTTVKTRVTAGSQQIVRFDEEDVRPLPETVGEELRRHCTDAMMRARACVISDYAKGVADGAFCQWLVREAAQRGIPVVVDPKSRDLRRYRGATVITPNLKETGVATGDPVHNAEELNIAAGHLLPGIAPSALLVTRGGDGMSLFEQGEKAFELRALAVEVADVTGAGDTVAAILALALAVGFSLREAARIANVAAGLVVRHHGTWAVQPRELLEAALT